MQPPHTVQNSLTPPLRHIHNPYNIAQTHIQLKYYFHTPVHAMNRILRQDFAGYIDLTHELPDLLGLTCDAARSLPSHCLKKFINTPCTISVTQCSFSACFIICEVGCLSQGEGGAKRRNKVKREPYRTDTWGRNSQSA